MDQSVEHRQKLNVPLSDLLTFAFDQSIIQDVHKPIYIDAEDPSHKLSAFQTKLLVRKLIAGFKANGLQQGDSVLVVLANTYLYSSIYFSIIGAGGIYVGINPASQAFEISHILTLGEPKYIITSSDLLPHLLQSAEASSFPKDRLFIVNPKSFLVPLTDRFPPSPPLSEGGCPFDSEAHKCAEFLSLIQHGESDWVRIDDEETARTTPAAMFSTSGTSGLPKMAILSHYAMISQHLSLEYCSPYQVTRLISLPFFHVFAALFTHVFPIRLGQPLYILPRFQLDQYVNAIQRFQITDTVMAPPIIHTLNRSQLPLNKLLESIRWIGVGGAPIGAEAMQLFRTHLDPSATLSQVWGMTEIGAAMLVRHPEQNCDGSIGRPLPGYEMQLLDSFGNLIMSDDEPGELHVRYDGMMSGYKNQIPHTRGDWYSTGDIMTRSQGKYYVVGRSKELIKVNGWQVAPAELEAVLLSHPCVKDTGVIGVLSENGDTEVPRAYIVREGGVEGRCSSLSAEEIYDYTRSRLASYKALKGGIFFVDHIPRTASGKIQRFKLGQMDHYRRSVTELLVLNSALVAESKKEKITDLKARADERRTSSRRCSRVGSSHSGVSSALHTLDLSGISKPPRVTRPRRRSRVSLVDKLKALEASRMPVDGNHSVQ